MARLPKSFVDAADFLGITPRRGSKGKAMSKTAIARGFDAVVQWLDDRGYEVDAYPGAVDQVCFEEYCVHINSNKGAESQLYTLLHEAGHVIIREDWSNFSRYYPRYLRDSSVSDGRRQRSRSHRVALVAEEYEAWRRGLQLAWFLAIPVNAVRYDEESSRALMSYITWTAVNAEKQRQAGQKAAATRKSRSRRGR